MEGITKREIVIALTFRRVWTSLPLDGYPIYMRYINMVSVMLLSQHFSFRSVTLLPQYLSEVNVRLHCLQVSFCPASTTSTTTLFSIRLPHRSHTLPIFPTAFLSPDTLSRSSAEPSRPLAFAMSQPARTGSRSCAD